MTGLLVFAIAAASLHCVHKPVGGHTYDVRVHVCVYQIILKSSELGIICSDSDGLDSASTDM